VPATQVEFDQEADRLLGGAELTTWAQSVDQLESGLRLVRFFRYWLWIFHNQGSHPRHPLETELNRDVGGYV